MTTQQTRYRARKLFYFFGLVFLCLSRVEATSYNKSNDDGDKRAPLMVQSSSDSDIRSLTPHNENISSNNNASDAEKLAMFIIEDINAISRRRSYVGPSAIKSHATLMDLLEKASEGQPERFCNALTISNLNLINQFHEKELYNIIGDYLQLEEVPSDHKKQLKEQIKASDIVPKKHCESCVSVIKRWEWSVLGCGGTTGIFWAYCIPHSVLAGSAWTISCCFCCVLSYVACMPTENARLKLARRCINPGGNLKCHQKMAMVNVGCLEE